jgi:hypothetical protein
MPDSPPAPPPPRQPPQPEWAGPPQGVLPGVSPQRVVVFKTDRAFLMAHRFFVYPNGVAFALHLLLRYPDEYQHDVLQELHGRRPGPPSDDFLRLGLLFSGGTKWTNLEQRWQPRHRHDQPPSPYVMNRGGGGGPDAYNLRFWMWPLPQPGPLTVVGEWPVFDVPESRAVIDATELRARAAEAESIWPD